MKPVSEFEASQMEENISRNEVPRQGTIVKTSDAHDAVKMHEIRVSEIAVNS